MPILRLARRVFRRRERKVTQSGASRQTLPPRPPRQFDRPGQTPEEFLQIPGATEARETAEKLGIQPRTIGGGGGGGYSAPPSPPPTTGGGGLTPEEQLQIPGAGEAEATRKLLDITPTERQGKPGIGTRFKDVIQTPGETKTREEFLRERQLQALQSQVTEFETLTPEEVRARAFQTGTGVTGMTTAEGEVFTFTPTETQIKAARGTAVREFKEKPLKERILLTAGEVRVGAAKGVLGAAEFGLDVATLPLGFGGAGTKEQLFNQKEPVFGGRLISERKFVKEIRDKPTSIPGLVGEAAVGVGIIGGGAVGGAARFGALRGEGLTRTQTFSELAADISPAQFQRTFVPSPKEVPIGKITEISVKPDAPVTQIFEGGTPGGIKVRQVGLAGETATGKPISGSVVIAEQPKTQIRFDISGADIVKTTRTDIVSTIAAPRGKEFPAPVILRDQRGAVISEVFPKTIVQDVGVRPLARITETPTPKETTIFLEPLGGKPSKVTSPFFAEKPLTTTERPFGRFQLKEETFKFAVGEEPTFIGKPRVFGQPREIVSPGIEPRVTGIGRRFQFRPGDIGKGFGTKITPKKTIQLQDQDLGSLAAQTSAALKSVQQPAQAPTITPTIAPKAPTSITPPKVEIITRQREITRQITAPTVTTTVDTKLMERTRMGLGTGLRVDTIQRQTGRTGTVPRLVSPQSTGLGQGERLLTGTAIPTPQITELTTPTRPRGGFFFEFEPIPPRTPGFGGLFIPGLGFRDLPKGKRRGRRRFERVPSLAAVELGITAPKPIAGEFTGLIARPVIRKKRRKR